VLVPCVDEEADGVIARCRAALAERGEGFVVTTSAGTASVPRDCRDVRAALAAADTALYGEKARFRSTDEREATGALLQSVSERDPALGGHMRAVARLAILVARRLGLDEAEVAVVAAAAELHDVGKMAVPDAVLRKPGPLDGDEWRLVRRHTLAGERILRAAPGLQHVAPVVRASHERWDGSGYPDGLAGEHIPLAARIVAACDAYDAMRTDRPHRAALPAGATIAELRRGAGTEFDPAVVEAVIAEVSA
jgi:HD-GYP domain-containing protein (c-di-GMP phosphodiesterase class II)